MARPGFASAQSRAEETALRRLANVRLTDGATAFDALMARETHPLGLVGEMGELRHTLRLPRADMPVCLARDSVLSWDTESYSAAELLEKTPAEFTVDAVESYGEHGVRIWLR
jgi:hypothetical protein